MWVLCFAATSGSLRAESRPEFDLKAFSNRIEALAGEHIQGFKAWRNDRLKTLEEGARVVRTAVGPIQYKQRGHGPVVICLHGGFGGYDQAFLMGSFLVNRGFTVLALSRPGYLGTPLSVGESITAQADATVHLMDALGIKKAVIYGFSAGSPIAFQVGLRHPDRVAAVIATGVGAPPGDAPYYTAIEAFLKADVGVDLLAYGLYLLIETDLRAVGELMFWVDTNLSGKALETRLDYVLRRGTQQRIFLKKMAVSLTPMNARRTGLINDVEVLTSWNTFERKGELEKLKTPMLFVDARNDANGSYPQTVRFAGKIPGAKLITVQQSGHFVWLGMETNRWENRMVRYLKDLALGTDW